MAISNNIFPKAISREPIEPNNQLVCVAVEKRKIKASIHLLPDKDRIYQETDCYHSNHIKYFC